MKDQSNVFLQTFALIMFTLKNVPLNTHVIRYMFHEYHPRQRYHGEIEQIEHEIQLLWKVSISASYEF